MRTAENTDTEQHLFEMLKRLEGEQDLGEKFPIKLKFGFLLVLCIPYCSGR